MEKLKVKLKLKFECLKRFPHFLLLCTYLFGLLHFPSRQTACGPDDQIRFTKLAFSYLKKLGEFKAEGADSFGNVFSWLF